MLSQVGDSQHSQNSHIKCWKSLHQLGYVNRFDIWVLCKLSEDNILVRISACDSLLKRNENVPFLKQIGAGNEWWILYNNMKWKRSWGK